LILKAFSGRTEGDRNSYKGVTTASCFRRVLLASMKGKVVGRQIPWLAPGMQAKDGRGLCMEGEN
jgi:hypothetical protein